jgi:TolA-binding protein
MSDDQIGQSRQLSAFVGRDLTERELTDQWANIEGRLQAKQPMKSFRVAAALALLLGVAAVVFVVLGHKRPVASAWDGAVLDSGADHVSVALGDGSHIELMPASRVAVVEGSAHAVRLDVRKGSAHFDVTHVSGRTFFVKSGNVTIRVVGTRFSVTTAAVPFGRRITVAVDEGVVEAASGPGAEPTQVRAGQTWSTVETTEPTASKSEPAPRPSSGETSETKPNEPSPSVAAIDHRSTGASAERPARAEPTAQELFESANSARQAGNAREAATSYEALLHRYPADARAGLAAFELGRLKMDQLGDTRGAIAALQRAVTGAPSSGFREDALARLARAYGTLGKVESCERMRSAYLASYPNGVHAAAVRKACGDTP